MRSLGVVAILLVLAVPALAQDGVGVGVPNPNTPITVIPPPDPVTGARHPGTGQPGFFVKPTLPPFDPADPNRNVRPSLPFVPDEPHQFNNPHPMTPNAGLGYALRQWWVAPQPVVLQLYVPVPTGLPERYEARYAEVPGFYVTETSTGYVYPARWTIDQLNVGVYQWRMLPAQFFSK